MPGHELLLVSRGPHPTCIWANWHWGKEKSGFKEKFVTTQRPFPFPKRGRFYREGSSERGPQATFPKTGLDAAWAVCPGLQCLSRPCLGTWETSTHCLQNGDERVPLRDRAPSTLSFLVPWPIEIFIYWKNNSFITFNFRMSCFCYK